MTVMVLPLRSAGLLMPESSRTTSCMNPLPPNTATIFTGTPLPRTQNRPAPHDPPEGPIAGAHHLGHVHAAAADRKAHVEPRLGKITLPFGKLDRTERRQHWRRWK